MIRRVFVVFLFVMTLAAFIISPGEAGILLRYGHEASITHPQHLGALAFAKHVAERTRGEIEVEVFPFGQLGPQRSMAEQVYTGTLQMTAVSPSVLSNFVQEVGIIELPFVYPDIETAYRTLDDKEVKAKFFKYCASKGFAFIGYGEEGFRDLTNSRGTMRRPDDMRGLKMRVLKTPIYLDTFKTLGASPVSLPFTEIYSALQQKTIDGQDNPFEISVAEKFTQVNKFVTLTHHILVECPVIVNKRFWDSLSPEQQNILREAADIQIRVNRDGNAKARAEAMEKARVQGAEVIALTVSERQAFRDAVKPLYEKYRSVFGSEWHDFFMRKIGR